jgi:AraC-like DNA-binding protein
MNIYSIGANETCGAPAFEGAMAPARVVDEKEYSVIRSHAPSATARQVFNVVLNSGHFRASPNYREDGRRISGHELLYCVSGSGYVVSGRRHFRLRPYQLAWLSGFSDRWAGERTPWEVLWIRIEGYQIEQAWAALSVQERPIFEGLPQRETAEVFHRVNRLLTDRPSRADAALNSGIAQLLGYLVESREANKPPGRWESQMDYPELRSALEVMITEPNRSWRAGELAKLCGLSERHFFRRFRHATGFSPINWLRRERINLAQVRLQERGSGSIKQIAEEAGYNDVFFFSRDFKRLTGSCPSEYRRARFPAANGEGARRLSFR